MTAENQVVRDLTIPEVSNSWPGVAKSQSSVISPLPSTAQMTQQMIIRLAFIFLISPFVDSILFCVKGRLRASTISEGNSINENALPTVFKWEGIPQLMSIQKT